MAGSDITVSSLVAVPRVQGNKLAWAANDPWPKDMSYSLGAVEVHASLTNDRATATKVGEGLTDFHHAGLAEEVTWYYWIKARNKVGVGSYGPWYPVSATAGVASRPLGQAGSSFILSNGKLVASVAGNALTLAVKTLSGNDPSASDPVYIAFRNVTLATGNYITRSLTSALSLTISNGSTLGNFASDTPFRIWVVVFDDGGTLRLSVFNASQYANYKIYSIDENNMQSAAAEGGAGAADSIGVYYATVAITSKPIRLLGYCEWINGLDSNGVWSDAPDITQMYGPDIARPSQQVQSDALYSGTAATGTTIIPFDATAPLISEGDQYFSLTYIMSSRTNFLDVQFFGVGSFSVAGYVSASLFIDGGPSLAVGFDYTDADQRVVNLHADLRMHGNQSNPTGTLTRIVTVRIGGDKAGTFTFNGIGGAQKLATVKSMLRITEIMG